MRRYLFVSTYGYYFKHRILQLRLLIVYIYIYLSFLLKPFFEVHMCRFSDLDHPPVRCQILSMTRPKEVPENGAGDRVLGRVFCWIVSCKVTMVVNEPLHSGNSGEIWMWVDFLVFHDCKSSICLDMQFGSDMQFWCFSSKRFTVYTWAPTCIIHICCPAEAVFHGIYWCMIHCLLNCARKVNPQYKWGSKNALLRENCGPHC